MRTIVSISLKLFIIPYRYGRSKLATAHCIIFHLIFLSHLSQADESLRIASASNFLPTLKYLAGRFEQDRGGHVTIISGSSGKLFTQIQHGLPVDIFLSADKEKPEKLKRLNFSLDHMTFDYAQGGLVFWSTHTNNLLGPVTLKTMSTAISFCNRISIANPKFAPYGIASIEVIHQLTANKHDKTYTIIIGENINQALQYKISNNADCAFIALSQATQLKLFSTDDTVLKIPQQWHKPIQQQAIILKSSHRPETAKAFINFLKSDEIQALIEQQGYLALH